MSSNITLSAATRQNLLSLQDTASLLSTTQNRLSTGKTVNNALDNPVNFFTADALSSRSNSLSSLLDGISNGIQTIQAANTGLTKLQGLTDQLKSVAQQALASSNAFSAKAQSVSGALTGATAANLLSTGPTQAVADTALGSTTGSAAVAATLTGTAAYVASAVPAKTSFAYTATAATAATASPGAYTATTATAATTTAGTAFTAPANAVASTYTGSAAYAAPSGTSTLTITLNGGTAQVLNLAANATISDIQTAITGNTALTAAGVTATTGPGGALRISANNGTTFTVQGSDAGLLGDTTSHAQAVTGTAAATQTVTINSTAITLTGSNAGSPAKTISDALGAINAQTATTGVTATQGSGADAGKIVLTGANTGAQVTVVGGTGNGFGFSTPSATTTNGATAPAQTLSLSVPSASGGAPTVTNLTIPGGTSSGTLKATVDALLGSSGFTSAITGSTLTFSRADGQNFSISGSTGNTFAGVANTGTPTVATATNGVVAAAQTVSVNGTAISIAGASNQAAAIGAINAYTAATGVTARQDPADATKIQFVGKDDGSNFTLQGGSGNTFTSLGTTSTAVTGTQGAAQSVTLNGTRIDVGASSTGAQAVAAINAQSTVTGVTASLGTSGADTGKIILAGATDGSTFTVEGSVGNTLGFTSVATPVSGTFKPSATTLVSALGFKTGDNFTVNGQTVNVGSGDTLSSLAQKVSVATNGVVSASYDATSRKFTFTATDSNTAVTLANGSTATSLVSNLGFSAGKTNFAAGLGTNGSTAPLAGKSLSVQVGSGQNVSFTFGTAAGQVQSLTQLNAVLAGANAQASLDAASGKLTITTLNDFGAENLAVTGAGAGNPFNSGVASAVIGGDGANTRNNLVTSYNGLLNQINQLAADSGYNGVNLLSGDNLKLSFNEKNTSSLAIQGTTINVTNLGLSSIGNTDFQENGNINKLIGTINSASNVLKSQASSLGANLAVVQNRQDFTKQIINVLDTGASKLTNADLNEEAANSQALSTRNSLGISALALANQAQQGILQLLR